jgi:hypothetical protein
LNIWSLPNRKADEKLKQLKNKNKNKNACKLPKIHPNLSTIVAVCASMNTKDVRFFLAMCRQVQPFAWMLNTT